MHESKIAMYREQCAGDSTAMNCRVMHAAVTHNDLREFLAYMDAAKLAKEALQHSINLMSGVVMDNDYKIKSFQAALDAYHALAAADRRS